MQEHIEIEAERTLELLQRIFEALPQAVVVYDADGTLIYANEAAAGLGEASTKRELLQTHAGKFFIQREAYDEAGVRIPPEEYASRLAARGIPTKNKLVRQQYADGRQRWYSITSAPLYNRGGSIEYVVTFAEDVTDQKMRDDRVRFLLSTVKILSLIADSKERLRENANLIVPLFADWCTINIVAPDGLLSRVAVAHRDPTKTSLVEDLARRAPENGRDSVREVLESGQSQYYPVIEPGFFIERAYSPEWLALSRELRVCSSMIIPVQSHGKPLGVLSLAYAESGRHYTKDDLEFFEEYVQHISVVLDNANLFDEVRRRDEAKSAFIATLSHELRNPLAPIKSSLELLELSMLPKKAREYVAIIDSQFEHMTKLLNDLLNVTRFTQGNIELNSEPVDIAALAEETVRLSRNFIAQKHIALTFDAPQRPITLSADRMRLRQAITNLLHNAEKFTAEGGRISVEVSRTQEHAHIAVRDDGIGIAREQLRYIFDLDFKTKHRARSSSGLGIGLVLVQNIMELHGGSVDAYSAGEGQGATFTLTLPLTPSVAPEEKPPLPAPPSAQEAKKVLIVDDNEAAAKSMSLLLAHSGHRTQIACDGREAMRIVREFEPALVLLDIGLPDIDGYEVARSIRACGSRTVLVALTGFGQEEDKRKALDAGFDHHLTKPVSRTAIDGILATS